MTALKRSLLLLPLISLLLMSSGPIVFGQQRGQTEAGQAAQSQQPRQMSQQAQAPNPPEWAGKLNKQHQEYLDQLLTYWETSSEKIERYKCEFRRWVYDEAFMNQRNTTNRHLFAKTVATGAVRYGKPDKGMYETDDVWKFEKPPTKPGEEPEYTKITDEDARERWICDGKNIYEFQFAKKTLLERPLPPDQQGQHIADGPLPFLFGAKADEMKQRYWIRVITPEDAKGEYWLEAVPKRLEDAQTMQKVEVILDEADFLPKAITVFEVNHNPTKGMTRKTTFEFANREYNWPVVPEALQKFMGDNFTRPRAPLGWKKVDARTLQQAQQRQAQTQQQGPRR